MTSANVIAAILLVLLTICDSQFLTPDQLREQHDLGYGARTHYEMSGSRRTDMFGRVNPDYLLRGFFPFWSIVLVGLAMIFLTIAIVGLIGFFLGCRRPTPEELSAQEYAAPTPDNEFLLGTGENPDANGGQIPANAYYNNYDERGFRYESSPHGQRTRIGQSDEDMV